MIKNETAPPDETPKKRRGRAAAAEVDSAESVAGAESAAAEGAVRRPRRRAASAVATEPENTEAAAAEPRRRRARKAEASEEPVAASVPAAPTHPPASAPAPVSATPATPAASTSGPAPSADAPLSPGATSLQPEAPAPVGATAPGQASRHPRHERHRGRPERHQPQGSAPAAEGAPGGVPQGQGGGRRRRRRGRGGGQGQVLPGGQLPPALEAQLQPALGVLEVDERGNGKLRRQDKSFLATETDPDVPKQVIERYRLRPGVLVQGSSLPRNGKPTVHRVDLVDGLPPEEAQNRLSFMNLTSIDPDKRIVLETTPGELLTRVIDIVAPIGFGQRGLIVAPPKTGKTIILQKIAKAVLTNHPKARLMVLLIDERPEEVTDFRRSIGADVYASSSDRPAHEHLRVAEIVIERARRLVEAGEDVVVLLDSITRLARAYNKEVESSGRTMSGGVDSRALERPKRIFGAARNTEEAGSLTILGTALIDTGSRMDEVIFEEFKGTGNMEIVLDRALGERRLWPAINVNNSGTRKEEKIFTPKEAEKNRKLRAYLAALRPIEAMEKLLGRLRDFRTNDEFYDAV